MSGDVTDLHAIGRLVQFGLRSDALPSAEPEYRQLLERYNDDSDFSSLVHALVEGLGLAVLEGNRRGLILVPTDGSAFEMRWSDYRPSSHTADDRLLDGLINVGIMATVFPLARDLEDDPTLPRMPITVDEVEQTLRSLAAKMHRATQTSPDLMSGMEPGMIEAWRVYSTRSEVGVSKGTSRSTRGLIEYALEFLRRQGCFTKVQHNGRPAHQPTWRYHILVQEFSAEPLYLMIQAVRNENRAHEES
jgi:hypothetical protein